MKKILLIIGLFFTSITLFSQTEFTNIFDNVYKNVKFDTVSSGILHNRVIFSLANLKNYNDVPDTTNAKHFIQAYYELQNATVTKDKIFDRSIDELYLPMNIPNDSNINIGIIYSDYHIIDTNAFYNGKLLIIDSSIYINDTNSNPLFTKKTLFLSSPLINYTHNLYLNFSINSDYYFKNTEISINKLLINFGDGLSFREFIIDSNFNIIQNIIYSNYGEKIITLKGITEYGDTLTSFAKIFVRAKADLVEKERKADFYIVSDISYKGNGETTAIKGEAEMRVYYSDETVESKQIKRPILIVDGFDPGDKRQFEEDIVDNPADDKGGIWGLLKYEYNEDTIYLGDTLLKKGYDIIILNFPLIKVSNQHNSSFDPNGYYYRDGGSDFIERNALACIKAIDTINYFLKEFGSKEQLVIIGPSMGGQITRYALNYMEDSLPSRDYREHNTRLWVSFDSPHQGANIPLGAQAAVKYFGNISSDAYLKYDNILRSTAARQMLLLHLETYNKDNYSCSHDPLYSLYYNKVYDMGFLVNYEKLLFQMAV
ncbi:MAG: hypothetical protein H6Q16_597 [Bacteroidetes bacterium]|nr:hypothetical protein [Bacteroidota bacterium]